MRDFAIREPEPRLGSMARKVMLKRRRMMDETALELRSYKN